MKRAYYLDRLRVVLTALVVFHHTAIAYGAPGGWYYLEMPLKLLASGLLLILFVSVNQAYFMGYFFLIAGYFTPGSYERKGAGQFLKDRLVRLGIPLVVFVYLIDPLTIAMVAAGKRGDDFGQALSGGLMHPGWGTGPLWFAEALLIFSVGYVGWRAVGRGSGEAKETAVPGGLASVLSAAGVGAGAGALLLRQWVPVGQSLIGLQVGYFSSYVFLFGLGTVAWRREWFAKVTWKQARPWMVLSVALLPAMVVVLFVTQKTTGKLPEVNTGFSVPAIVYALWEPFIAWGIIAGLIVGFREWGNRASRVWEFLGARAYAVYIVHAPVLVGVALLLRSWHGPALAKVAVVGTLACVGSLGVGSLLMGVPGARRVL